MTELSASTTYRPLPLLPTLDALTIVENGQGGWRVRETDEYWVEIYPYFFNDRMTLTPKAYPDVYDHGWCYPPGGAAFLAANVWDPDTEAEPIGWIKRVTPRRELP